MNAPTEFLSHLDDGDLRSAAAWLARHHANDVLSLCTAMVRDRPTAEDLTQDVFGKAFAALPGFRQEASPRTWLMAIARNRCLDHLRRAQRQPWTVDDLDGDDGIAPDEPAPLPADLLSRRESVEQALGVLDEAQRALVVLRFRHEMEYAEIAEVLGVKPGTARMRVSRALTRMRQALESSTVAEAAMARSFGAGVPTASPLVAQVTPAAPKKKRGGLGRLFRRRAAAKEEAPTPPETTRSEPEPMSAPAPAAAPPPAAASPAPRRAGRGASVDEADADDAFDLELADEVPLLDEEAASGGAPASSVTLAGGMPPGAASPGRSLARWLTVLDAAPPPDLSSRIDALVAGVPAA